MTDRDKLIELLKGAENKVGEVLTKALDLDEWLSIYADYLLANGVIVPPCKVGDKVWYLHQRYNGTFVIQEGKISMLTQKADKSWRLRITVNSSVWGFTPNEIGTRYFITKEDAEKELKRRSEGNA